MLMSFAICLAYYGLYQRQMTLLIERIPSEVERCEIISIPETKERYQQYYCEKGNRKVLVRIELENLDHQTVRLGDQIMMMGKVSEANENTVPYLFNYKRYLLSKEVYYLYTADFIEKESTSEKWHFKLINTIIDRYQGELSSYQLSLLIGSKNGFDDEMQNKFQSLNISHLFVVSGFHVGALIILIQILLRKLHVTKEKGQICIIFILLFYLFINNFQTSILRAVMFYYLIQIKNLLRLKIGNIHLLAFICLINLLKNPFIIYDTGFQLSYLITFILILSNKIIVERSRNKYLIIFTTGFIAQAFSLPIIANFNFTYNFLSLILSPLLTLYFTLIIFPITFLTLIFDFATPFVLFLFTAYERLIVFLVQVDLFKLTVGAFDLTRIVIYYGILVLFMNKWTYNKRLRLLLCCLISLILVYHRFSITTSVAYIDVGQGDSSLIKTSMQSCTMLIDTGGASFNSSFHPGERHVIPYLKSQQITKLDYLIISHSDRDHAGDVSFILDAINVKSIVFSHYDDSELKQEILAIAKEKSIPILSLKAGDQFTCGKVPVQVLGPIRNYDTINDNSLVLNFRLNEDRYLFTGDIASKVEEELIGQYDVSVNFLKIAHHGSKFSTSTPFLNDIKPHYAIISSGVNYYGHPSEDVLKRLKQANCVIYHTKENGTIIVKYFFNKRVIKHH
jgi:competence protein ComEC